MGLMPVTPEFVKRDRWQTNGKIRTALRRKS